MKSNTLAKISRIVHGRTLLRPTKSFDLFSWKRRVGFNFMCTSYTTRQLSYNEMSTSDDIASLIHQYASESQTSASLQTLVRTGRGELLNKTYKDKTVLEDTKVASERVLMQVASFLRHELPIRLAHRIQDLDNVPFMRDMPSVKNVKQIYISSFLEILDTPCIDTPQKEIEFYHILKRLYSKHSSILMQMAKGAFELRGQVQKGKIKHHYRRVKNVEQFDEMKDTHEFLDRFYMSRIGIRVIAAQYLALHEPSLDGWIGLIYDRVSPETVVRQAAEDATVICNRKYGDAPHVEVSGRLDLTFPYLPDHLHYILLELIKNSMRATVDWHGIDNEFPPIQVIIADGNENEDVVIKVSDEGGGIPRSNTEKIWSYLFTTADPTTQERMVSYSGSDHSTESPLAGLGYGLPISRSYARYFGGDLDIMSMDGYGTDAFVHLSRLGDSKEPLL